MMNRLITITATFAVMAVLVGSTASADNYPIVPPGASVTLITRDFIQAVPLHAPGVHNANSVIGNNLNQHPGTWLFDDPWGNFLIGVFGGPIDTSNPYAAVYLWETSGYAPGYQENDVPQAGPQIQLGFWDGTGFTAYGKPQDASYLGTGVVVDLDLAWNGRYEITSSITPLSDFDIAVGFPMLLNAVRIEATEFGLNRVTAVAAHTIPEPSSVLLLGTCLVGLAGCTWLRRN